MSALTDLFTSMANKIRSKTGGSGTYTPTEMVSAIDDVYDAGYADATTPITPSNSSPASMTSGNGYKPTANGYAISSYSEITPSPWQSGTPISSGDIIRFTGDGYAVPEDEEIAPRDVEAPRLDGRTHYFVASRDGGYAVENQPVVIHPSDSNAVFLERGLNYNIMYSDGYAIENQPTALTPSDSSPASISSGTIYKGNGAGYAIENYNTITPSDVPVYVNGGTIHKINGSGANVGCFIDGLAQRTPSDSYPYPVSVGSNYRIINNAGYLYKTNHSIGKFDTEEDVTGANQGLVIETGLPTIRRFFLRCEGNNGGSYHSYVCWTAADNSNYEGGTFSGTGSVSGIYNVKELNTQIHIYCPVIVTVSGETVTLKTGNNAQCAIKNAWWMACS